MKRDAFKPGFYPAKVFNSKETLNFLPVESKDLTLSTSLFEGVDEELFDLKSKQKVVFNTLFSSFQSFLRSPATKHDKYGKFHIFVTHWYRVKNSCPFQSNFFPQSNMQS